MPPLTLPAWLLRRRRPAAATGAAGDPEAPADPKAPALAAARGYDIDDHQLTLAQLAKRYAGVDPSDPAASKGLSEADALALRHEHGPNRLTPPKETPEIVKFLRQLANPLLLMLLAAGALTFMAYGIATPRDTTNAILASALVAVVLVTALTSYAQERSAGSVMASLGRMMPAQCTVVRAGGVERRVDASDLVPGDVVRLRLGDRVPADVRVVHAQDLKLEMSSLTGESDLVGATVDARHPLPAEARNVAFASSLVMQGGGTGVVVRTGDRTMIGQIAALATDTRGSGRSTLEAEVHRLVVFVACLALAVAVALFVIGLAQVREAKERRTKGGKANPLLFTPPCSPRSVAAAPPFGRELARFRFLVSASSLTPPKRPTKPTPNTTPTKPQQPQQPQHQQRPQHHRQPNNDQTTSTTETTTAPHQPPDRLCQRLHPRHRRQRARGPARHRHLAAVADGAAPEGAAGADQAHEHHRVARVGDHHCVGQDG